MSHQHESPFLRRFDALWSRLRRVRLGQAISLTGLVAVGGLVLLIALDYSFELPWEARAVGAGLVALATVAWLVRSAWLAVRAGNRPQTAAEIEQVFPQLGQSVRTTVQYGAATAAEVQAAGVRTSLVAALEEDTHFRSRPLHLDDVVPTRRLWATVAGVVTIVVVLLGAAGFNWEWRTASARALLAETPYTELSVEPGNLTVDEGQPVEIALNVTGRTGRKVSLFTRAAGDANAEWTEREFKSGDGEPSGNRAVRFVAKLDAVKKAIEYRAVAGPAASGTFRINVRHPLAIKQIEVELSPPAYTGHPPAKSQDANITAVEGTVAKFEIELDRVPRTASLVLTDIGRKSSEDEPDPQPKTVPLAIEDGKLVATLPLTSDQKYSIVAETDDGLRLPENSHRIRVRPDQAPEVYFEEPRDPIDVHTLAELLMRVRVRDDFGLTKAGIIFEVNNEEEYPLLTQEFATAAEELRQTGQLTPETQAALEKVLPLEHFQLSQKDSVAYYAFAEDNYPDKPHRTVTDLRFVDIRPFRITYKVFDPPPGEPSGMQRPRIATLEEIINRQRFNLNRTMGLARKFERQEKIDLNTVDSITQSETDIAQATRELTDFLGGLMRDELNDEIQLLLQAEANMLAAIDSLAAGKYDTAVLQERDALKELIEGRNRLQEAIMKNPKAFQSLSAADRRMAQKLRRPKSDKEEAEEVVRRLKQLAMQETDVQTALNESMNPDGQGATKSDAPPSDAAEGKPDDPTSESRARGMSREEMQRKQLDVSLESQDVEKALGKLKGITDLAKNRMTEATKTTDEVLGLMDRGDSKNAAEKAEQASAMFAELATQVEGLIAKEAAERVAVARNIANQLAQMQQEVAMQSSSSEGQKSEARGQKPADAKSNGQGSGGKPNEPSDQEQKPDEKKTDGKQAGGKPDDKQDGDGKSGDEEKQKRDGNRGKNDDSTKPDDKLKGEGLARKAERSAETGKTVLDILQSVLKSTDPNDKEVIGKVDELLRENKISETVDRMSSLPGQIREGRWSDVRVTAADNAERWEATANRLDVAFRQITAPKLEDLMNLERRLQELRERLEQLDSERAVVQWHIDAGKLLEEMQRLRVGEKQREELRELMRKAGWSEDATRFRLGGGWVADQSEHYVAAPGYAVVTKDLVEEVQAHIQELILGDLLSGKDAATPPQYERLVERYYQVLASGKRTEKKSK